MIPFNKPYLSGKEIHYIYDAVYNEKHISGNGKYTKLCQSFFQERYGFKKCLLTTSCTDALEMAALLCDIKHGDEVIIPSYTFVSTALAFVRQGAVIRFVDSRSDHPGMNEDLIETLITPKTKAIVPVHYAGVACNIEKINQLAAKYNLFVIEDASHSIESYYKNKALGSIGHLACFSFHETKNIQCGEGGLLAINHQSFAKRAEILWEKGTNRAEFYRGEVNKYGWVDIGSSFLPSEINAAFLYAQLENIDAIQNKRKLIWDTYYEKLKAIVDKIRLPFIPDYATKNGHLFYMVCNSIEIRDRLIVYLRKKDIHSVFHYLSLHNSPFYSSKHDGRELNQSIKYSDCLLRLPLFYELTLDEVHMISDEIINFFKNQY
jgi:dTDP-4-amino-4,6-dideoxygalactose transaminase